MSDARALLRAKRQEARISHPYASYSSSGQLRCSVCSTAVKQASMWEGHIGSKAHRVAVSKLREKEEEEEERKAAEKRKLEVEAEAEAEASASSNKKRRVVTERAEAEEGTSRPSKSRPPGAGFPENFFSDPSRAIPIPDDDEDEDEVPAPSTSISEPKAKTQLDLDFEAFEAGLRQTQAEQDKEEEKQDAYARATVAAEPELLSNALEGLPQNSEEAEIADAEQKEETEEEKRKRKEQEDRELIMDRLIEEERAQEEADMRVNVLKAKLEAAKRARSERKKNS